MGGLLGRAVQGVLGSVMRTASEQLARSARESQTIYEHASSSIRNSSVLASKMGGPVSVGPPLSQSMSSSNINGVVTKRVTLMAPVYGPGGAAATAHISSVEGQSHTQITITVRLATGQTVLIGDEGGKGQGRHSHGIKGEVIDAEFTELK